MVIHHETCHNVSEIRDNPEKCVFLTWDDDLNGEFYTALRIQVEAQIGVIAKIASAVSVAGAAIDRINREERDAKISVIVIEVGVRDRQHLANVVRHIRRIKSVMKNLTCTGLVMNKSFIASADAPLLLSGPTLKL